MTTELLTDTGHSRSDLAMIRRAIREGWDIPEQLLSALPKVAGAMALNTQEKTANRLKAIETLIKMKEQNEKREHQTVTHPQPQTTINVGVNVDNRTDERRNITLAIAERVRARRVLGSDTRE